MEQEINNFAPMGSYVLLKKIVIKGKEKKSNSGLILLTTDTKSGESELAPDRAAFQVVAIGPYAWSAPEVADKPHANVGDFVIFNDYDAKYITRDNGVDYALTRDVSIMAVVPNAMEF